MKETYIMLFSSYEEKNTECWEDVCEILEQNATVNIYFVEDGQATTVWGGSKDTQFKNL